MIDCLKLSDIMELINFPRVNKQGLFEGERA